MAADAGNQDPADAVADLLLGGLSRKRQHLNLLVAERKA
jgi:hypothetical protein